MQVLLELANWVQTSLTVLKIKTLAGRVNCKSKILHDRLALLALICHHATISRVYQLHFNLHSKRKYHGAANTCHVTEQGVRRHHGPWKPRSEVPKKVSEDTESGPSPTLYQAGHIWKLGPTSEWCHPSPSLTVRSALAVLVQSWLSASTPGSTVGRTWITEPAIRGSWEPCAGSTARPACHTTSSATQQGLRIPEVLRCMPLCAERGWDGARASCQRRP